MSEKSTPELFWVSATAELLKGFHLNLSHGICGDCVQTLYPEETVKA